MLGQVRFITRQKCFIRVRRLLFSEDTSKVPSETTFSSKPRGLLTGISDVSKAKDYSRTMNVGSAVGLLRDTKHIYNVALDETHGSNADLLKSNLTEVIKKAKVFMRNRDEVRDRDELKSAIQSIHSDVGKFVCVLGGKSTGKSLVIKNVEKLNMNNVFVVDLRLKGSDILKGLVSVIMERRRFYEDNMEQKGAVNIKAAIGSTVADQYNLAKEFENVLKVVNAIIDKDSVEQPLEVLINELVKRVYGNVTLIIDEANLAFMITPDTKVEDIKAMKHSLALFTSLTKAQGKV